MDAAMMLLGCVLLFLAGLAVGVRVRETDVRAVMRERQERQRRELSDDDSGAMYAGHWDDGGDA